MITSTRTLASLAVALALLLLGASRAAALPIELAPEMNDTAGNLTAGNMTEMANDTITDDENLGWLGGEAETVGENALQGVLNQGATDLGDDINSAITGRRSLLDGGIPLTVEGSDTTTSLGDELEGLVPHLEKIPPENLDMAPLAELEAEAPAFENSPSGVAGVDFAAGPESSASEDPAPSGEASPEEGGITMDDTMVIYWLVVRP